MMMSVWEDFGGKAKWDFKTIQQIDMDWRCSTRPRPHQNCLFQVEDFADGRIPCRISHLQKPHLPTSTSSVLCPCSGLSRNGHKEPAASFSHITARPAPASPFIPHPSLPLRSTKLLRATKSVLSGIQKSVSGVRPSLDDIEDS
jgi:hypothetical protein